MGCGEVLALAAWVVVELIEGTTPSPFCFSTRLVVVVIAAELVVFAEASVEVEVELTELCRARFAGFGLVAR